MIRVIWRSKEFKEFITFRSWAFARRRVNEIPAYLYPIGFGFSIVRPLRQGFWKDKTGQIWAGFLSGPDNFHYVSAQGDMRSEPNWPEPILEPMTFEEGFHKYKDQRWLA